MWKLVFRSNEKATDVYNTLIKPVPETAPILHVADDFGQMVAINAHGIRGLMLEDLEQSKLAHIEMSLHEARVRSKAGQMAQADPSIRQAAMMQGPAVLAPGMLNGRM